MASVVVSVTLPSTMRQKLVDASMKGKVDDVRGLLKTATAEEVNWQDEVKLYIHSSIYDFDFTHFNCNNNVHFDLTFITGWFNGPCRGS